MVAILFVCALAAFALSAVCGGGAGLLLMPLLGSVLPITGVPAALSIGTVSSSASRIVVFFGQIRWDIAKWFIPSALPAVFFGSWLLRFVNPVYLEIAMGIFLVGNLPTLLTKKKAEQAAQGGSKISLVVIGFLAGFLSGLTGAVGLIFNRFYLKHGLTKEEIVATRAANEITLHAIKLALYASLGLMSIAVIKIGVAVAVAGLFSSGLMNLLIRKISESLFRKTGYAAMVLSGIVMLTQGTQSVFAQNNGYLSLQPISQGIESKIQWQHSNLAIEFQYDEGFEYEQQISISDLPLDKQAFVLAKNAQATKVVVEKVYTIGSVSYEAYYYDGSSLLEKIDFT